MQEERKWTIKQLREKNTGREKSAETEIERERKQRERERKGEKSVYPWRQS